MSDQGPNAPTGAGAEQPEVGAPVNGSRLRGPLLLLAGAALGASTTFVALRDGLEWSTSVESLSAQLPKSALVIGINDYNDGKKFDLPGAYFDAVNMATLLKAKGYSIHGGRAYTTSVETTASAVRGHLKAFFESAPLNGVLAIYIGGHGGFVTDGNKDEASSDHEDINDEVLVCSNLQGIRDDELFSLVSAPLRDRKGLIAFWFIDSCYSGTIFKLNSEELVGSELPECRTRFLDDQWYSVETDAGLPPEHSTIPSNMVFVAACLDGQQAAEVPQADPKGGLFTRVLFEELAGTGDQRLSALFGRVKAKVSAEATKYKNPTTGLPHRQDPELTPKDGGMHAQTLVLE